MFESRDVKDFIRGITAKQNTYATENTGRTLVKVVEAKPQIVRYMEPTIDALAQKGEPI